LDHRPGLGVDGERTIRNFTNSSSAVTHSGTASLSGNNSAQATNRRHAAIASRFKSCGHFQLAFSPCPLYPPKADIVQHGGNVRFGLKADKVMRRQLVMIRS